MPKSKLKIALKIIGVLIAIPVGLLVIWLCSLVGYGFYQEKTLPEICKSFDYHGNLLKEQTEFIKNEFSDRITKMYPDPITEDDLKKSLVKQGFHLPKHPNPDRLPKVWAYAEYNFIPCDQNWTVEWTTQGDGIAHDIHGWYNVSCL